MADFMSNPFISQKKKDALEKMECALYSSFLGHPEDLDRVLTAFKDAIIANLPAILDAWTEEEDNG